MSDLDPVALREHDTEIAALTASPILGADEVAWKVYERWCAATHQPARPTAEQAPSMETVLCRFVYTLATDAAQPCSAGYVRSLSSSVLKVHRHEGNLPAHAHLPILERLLESLSARERGNPPHTSKTQERADAIPAALLRSMVAHLDNSGDPAAIRLRGVIAIAEALGQDPTDPVHPAKRFSWWPRDHVRFESSGARIFDRATEDVSLLDRDLRPAFFASLAEAFEQGEDRYPLSGAGRAEMRAAWTRFDPSVRRVGTDPRPVAADVSGAWARSNVEDRELWLACADPRYPKRVRDKAYLLTGVFSGHRNAEFRDLTLGDLSPCDVGFGGYAWTVTTDKGNKLARALGGRVVAWSKVALHTARSREECSPMCAACALEVYLRLRQRAGATASSPLFTDLVEGTEPLGAVGASRMLQQLADAVEDEAVDLLGRPLVLSSRSTRVTAATNARLAGASLAQIAEFLGHRQMRTTQRYIRIHDPWCNDEFVLSFAALDDA